jgi:uncharacterized protein (TIGR03118 family)
MNAKFTILTGALAVATLLSGTALAKAEGAIQKPLIYQQQYLVADKPGVARRVDPMLVDPWGLVLQPNGLFWVADRAKGVATLYDGDGRRVGPALGIPDAAGRQASPTGVVWNPSQSFTVPGTRSAARFIFATLQGTIAARAPDLPGAPGRAVTVVDNTRFGAVYTGLAFGVTGKGAFLYAANIRAGRIDVFDSAFRPVGLPGRFLDPNIPAGFTPFNIQAIGGNLIVTYARRNAAKTFVAPGKGAGFVDMFDTSGKLVRRLAAGGALNAPWGVALAPAGFGGGSGKLIVGNFGDGRLFAVNLNGGVAGQLMNSLREPIIVPGLWALSFGTGSDPRTLFFTTGLLLELDGAFGSLTPVGPPGF